MGRLVCAEYLCLVLPRLGHFLKQTIAAVKDKPGTVNDSAWVLKIHELSKRVQGATCKVEMILKTAGFLKGDIDWRQRLESIHYELVQLLDKLKLEDLRKQRKNKKNRLTEEKLTELCDDVVGAVNLQVAAISTLEELCKVEMARVREPVAAEPVAAEPVAAEPVAAEPVADTNSSFPRMLKFFCKVIGAVVLLLAAVAGYLAKTHPPFEMVLWAASLVLALVAAIIAALPILVSSVTSD